MNKVFFLFSQIWPWLVRHHVAIATWLTTFLLTFPAYDVYTKRKRLIIILRDVTSHTSTRIVAGKSEPVEWTHVIVETVNPTDYPISITEIRINLFGKLKEKEKRPYPIKISEIEPRDNRLFSKEVNWHITAKDVFSIVIKSVDKKRFQLYPNGKWVSIVRHLISEIWILKD